MYESHFGLGANPFSPAPAPHFIYESKEYQEALAHFRYAIENREAFVLLTGEVGTGKTTAIQALRRYLPPHAPMAVVTHTTLEPKELLEEIALKFGLEPILGESKPALMHRLEAFLRDRQRGGSPALLILDEAHLLAPRLLEEVRLLSNLETENGKLLQICLVGQPELEAHLQQPELRQIRQRISVRYALRPLNAQETREYIVHRLGAAGASDPERLFPEDATAAVHQLTQGIPREINVLAGQSLLNAYLADSPVVTRAHAFAAKSDYGFEGVVAGPARMMERPDTPAGREPMARPVAPPPVPRKLPTQPPPPPRVVERAVVKEPEFEHEPEIEQEQRVATPAGRRPIPLPPASLRPGAPPPSAAVDPPRAPVEFSAGPGTLYRGASRKRESSRSPWVVVILVLIALGVITVGVLQQDGGPLEGLFSPQAETEVSEDAPQSARSRTANPSLDVQPVETPVEASPAGTPVEPADAATPPADALGTQKPADDAPAAVVTPEVTPPPTPVADTPQGAPDASASGYVAIQVASFKTRERANQVLADVTERTGLHGVIQSSDVSGTTWQRILLGAFSSEGEAIEAAQPLLDRRIIRDVVVRPIPPALLQDLLGPQ